MLNVLLHTEVADLQLVATNLGIIIDISVIPEMVANDYNCIVQNEADLILLANELTIQDNKFEVIGVWNVDGTPYVFNTPEKKAKFDFKIDKYWKKLKDKDVPDGVDAQGNPKTKKEKYTATTGKTKQVNKFFGWTDRIIANDVI